MTWITPVKGKVTDSRIVPGCWIESSSYGPSVLLELKGNWASLRYEATHMATQQKIWVWNTDNKIKFLREADDQSKHVLTLTGAYGLGPGRSDPRMP